VDRPRRRTFLWSAIDHSAKSGWKKRPPDPKNRRRRRISAHNAHFSSISRDPRPLERPHHYQEIQGKALKSSPATGEIRWPGGMTQRSCRHLRRADPLAQLKHLNAKLAPTPTTGVTAASHAIGLQERIVEIHYTHPALGLNIKHNSIVWLSTRA
jgi:hypothetical protein